jgi:DNA repair protein RecO (recombination protein O)
MAFTYTSDAIILKRWEYKEQDRMVRLLTRDFGKLTCRAISARKLESKLAGHLEPFIYTQAFFARSKTIDIIAGSNTIDSNARLRQSIPHYAIAGYFTEIVDRWLQEYDADPKTVAHVQSFLCWLNTHEANTFACIGAVMQFFTLLGYRMELYRCHSCQKPITYNGSKFHFQLWNVECSDCHSTEETTPLSTEAIKALRFFLQNDFDTIARLRVPNQQWVELHRFVRVLLRYHNGAELQSESIMLSLLSACSL